MRDKQKAGLLMRPDRLSRTQKAMYSVCLSLSLVGALFVAFAMSTVSNSTAWITVCFFGVLAFGLGLSWLLVKFHSPPVTCHSCGARGWLDDLTPETFFCPACGGNAFTYRRPRTTRSGHQIVPSKTEIVSGEILLSRAKGKYWD